MYRQKMFRSFHFMDFTNLGCFHGDSSFVGQRLLVSILYIILRNQEVLLCNIVKYQRAVNYLQRSRQVSYDSAPHPPPSPVSKLDRRHTGLLRKRGSLLTGGRWWAWSRIIRPQESQVLYKSLNPLWYSTLLYQNNNEERSFACHFN